MLPEPISTAAPAPRHRGAAPGGAGGTLLLTAFQAFYAEAARQKRLVAGPSPGGAPAPEAVRQRLVDFLEAQAVDVSRKLAEHELRVYDEAQYVMAAMADEVFLHLEWSGRSGWAERPLEAHMFHTHDAGERFFRKIDDVLANRATASTGVLLVYLAALALGFRGKYASVGMHSEPEAYRQRLARHIQRVDPGVMGSSDELCPEAHAHTLQSAPRTALPPMRRGWLPLLLVASCLLVLAQLVWSYQVSDVVDALDRIEEAS